MSIGISGAVDTGSCADRASADSVCQEFDRLLRSGKTPEIEDHLGRVAPELRAGLRARLVDLEGAFRRRPTVLLPDLVPHPARTSDEVQFLPPCGVDGSSDEARLGSTVTFPPASPQTPETPITLGGRIGRYRLDELIGRGGFGHVFRAYDTQLGRPVAVKILRGERGWSPDQIERFLEEAKKLAQLKHPGIVTVHDVGEDSGRHYLVAELIEGGTLAQRRLPSGALPWQQAASIVAAIAEALHHAHRAGFVHRDIKPSNILLRSDGRPCLADFGIAVTEEEQLAEGSGVVGSFGYMSPEQVRGESCWADARSDIYSLGVVLYELLTGRLPFIGSDVGEYRHQMLHRDARPPRTIRDEIPPEIEQACLKCLQRSPTDRFTTAADLAAALRAPLESGRVEAGMDRRGVVLWILTGAIAVMLAVGGWMAIRTTGAVRDVGQGGANAEAAGARPAPEKPPLPALEAEPARPNADALTVMEIRPSVGQRGSWEISDLDNSIRLISDEQVLLSLGELEGGSLDLSVVVSHRNGPGRLGLFWGYRLHDLGSSVIEFETLELKKDLEGKWGVSTSLRSMDQKTQRGGGNAIAGWATLPDVDPEQCRLSVQIREGKLVRIEVDERELPQVVAEHYDIAATRGRTSEGRFGLYALNTSGRLSEVRIDHAPRRLTGAAGRK